MLNVMRLLILLSVLASSGLASLSVMSSDSRGMSFHYEPGKLDLVPVAGKVRPDLADADHLAGPGEPDLPSRLVRIGIPQTGGVRVSFRRVRAEPVPAVTIACVPCVSWEEEQLADAGSSPPPGEAVELGPVQELRGIRFVTLRLNPLLPDPVTGAYSLSAALDVTLAFDSVPVVRPVHDKMSAVCARMLLNGALAVDWGQVDNEREPNQFERSANWLRVLVDSTAVYGISGRELAAAGLPTRTLDPATLAVYTIGERGPDQSVPDTMVEVPVLVDGGDDGRLDDDDLLVFYGLGADHWSGRCSSYVHNLYTQDNVYWMTWGGAAGRGMARGLGPDSTGARVAGAVRDVAHIERDLDCPARSGLLWIWSQLYKPADRASVSFSTDLDLKTPLRVRSIRGQLIADSSANVLTVRFNGRTAGVLEFGSSTPSAPYQFRSDSVMPCDAGRNRLDLELSGPGGKKAYVDFFDVEFQKRLSLAGGQLHFLADDTGTCRYEVSEASELPYVLDITNHYAPRQLLDARLAGDLVVFYRRLARPGEFVLATRSQLRRPKALALRHPGRLRAPSRQADYWVIAPAAFQSPAEALVRYRSGNVPGIASATAAVALLDDVYDDYAFGLAEPVAVKRFIADKRPSYVLLGGDATCDYRGLLGRAPSGVPAYEYGFGLNPDAYDRSALAFDAWYADFEGDGGSPDVMLGRVTARSAGEFAGFVAKLIRYETQPAGYWSRRYLLLADDEFYGSPSRPDPIGFQHIAYCEAMSILPDNLLDLCKVYLTEYPYVGFKNKPAAHARLMRELNRGAVALVFFGHGSGFDLTHESVLSISQVPELANGDRLPFCYFGSCSVGRFDDTQFECIAEEMVRMSGGGAIASVAATKATTSGSNQVFARNLLTPLFTMPDSSIGAGFFTAWPTDRIYHLFGDPATVLRLPARSTEAIAVRPDTLRPLLEVSGRANVETGAGALEWTLFGPRRIRTYRSSQGQTAYTLPGIEAGRGSGRVESGVINLRTMLPLGLPLDTVFVSDGFYAPVPRSCRIGAVVAGGARSLAVIAETVAYGATPESTADNAGPEVVFRIGSVRLTDEATVPASFTLEVEIRDSSGVMCAPVQFGAPFFYVNDRRSSVDVSDLLTFDAGSYRSARFSMPVSLAGDTDTLCAVVCDNALNQTVASVRVRPVLSSVLRVESLLVYPNPVRRDARFTFTLSRSAWVRARIYSLAGRLVADTGERPGALGFNEVYWDGQDKAGAQPANGIYLIALIAHTDDGKGGRQDITVRDRLIVHH